MEGTAGGLAGANAGSESDGGHPEVPQQPDDEHERFQEAPHGYDSRMTQRSNIDRLTSEMEELFADLCHHRLAPQRLGFRPRVDVFRTEEPPVLHVVAELPGIDPSTVDLAVTEGVLVISGRRGRPQGGGRHYQHIEIDYGRFERRIVLGDGFDADAAEATYEHGLLAIALPLRQTQPGPVRVPVRGGENG